MKPVDFKDSNICYARDQEEYQNLPAIKFPNGEVVSCWKLSLKERLIVLLKGRVWLALLSFNKPLTPSFMAVNRKDVYLKKEEEYEKLIDKVVKEKKKEPFLIYDKVSRLLNRIWLKIKKVWISITT